MAFWTYMLRCADGRFYVGQTDNLDRRMGQHEAGGFCDFTARRRPVELIWSESFSNRDEALAAKHRIKGWSRAKKQALIHGDWAMISWLAKPPSERTEARLSTSLRTNGGEDWPAISEGRL